MKKHLQVASVIALAVLVAANLNAQTISVNWTSVDEVVPVGDGPFLPRIASDWVYGSIVMLQAGTGFATVLYQTGNAKPTGGPLTSIDWCCYPGNNMNNEVGKNSSVGLVNSTTQSGGYDTALEVHQGGQDGGSLLFYSIGSAKVNSSQKIAASVNWVPSQSYDNGFNPTVGVDNSRYLDSPPPVNAAVVEVHQANSGSSDLWYHFGLLTGINGSSSSITWFPATQVQYTSGSTTTSISGNLSAVSLSDGLALLVFEGSSGDLYYSIGVNDVIAGITWNAPVRYTSGYRPSVSVYGCPTCSGWTVVEAHQSKSVSDGGGSLSYRAGTIAKKGTVLDGGTKMPTLVWTPDSDNDYDEGCFPSIAQNGVYLWETHASSCEDPIGNPDIIYSSFGQLNYSF